MSAPAWDGEVLLQPIRADRPCGDNLEDVPPLTTLDAMRLFGQSRSLDAPPSKDDPRKPPDWSEVQGLALDGLARSKDLRLLAYLGTAVLRTRGLPAFLETVVAGAVWLDAYWADVFPLVEEDGIARRNALNCFADPMAVLDRLRRTPIVESRQHGRVSLRDIDIAKGNLQPAPSEPRAEIVQINAAFGEATVESLQALLASASAAVEAVNRIDARMRDESGQGVGLEPLSSQLSRLNLVLQGHLETRVPAEATAPVAATVADGPAAGTAPGVIGSRHDATRALDAVAEYFRQHEPSSPVPLLIERAKRLVSKSFLEVLEDIAPDGLPGARAVGGVREASGE